MNRSEGRTAPTPTSARRHVTAAALALPILVLALAGCSDAATQGTKDVTGSAGPAGVTTSPSSATSAPATAPATASTTTASTTTASTTPAASRNGCAAGGTKIPAGASAVSTADLDGDGKGDTVWLADSGGTRTLGVRTAGGAGVSLDYSSASPIAARAAANTLSDGSSIVLLDTGRSVALYAFADCRIVPSLNAQGKQFTFDRGFTGYGTGVGCPRIGGGTRLVGYLVEPANPSGSKLAVMRTPIELSANGTRASNGATTYLAPSAEQVAVGRAVACGSAKFAAEPVS